MKAMLNVTRFNNEDVIATSVEYCAEVGTLHFFTTDVGLYDSENDQTTAPGISYIYQAPGRLRFQGDTLTMTIAGNVEIPVGKYYYFDGQGYTVCDPQIHAR